MIYVLKVVPFMIVLKLFPLWSATYNLLNVNQFFQQPFSHATFCELNFSDTIRFEMRSCCLN